MQLFGIFRHITRCGIKLLFFSSLLIIGCSGDSGGDTSGGVTSCQWGGVYLDTPTYTGLWGTDAAILDVGGAAQTPSGFDVAHCNTDPGYTILAMNETTGASVTGSAWSSVVSGYFGSYCDTRWWAYSVPLAPASNHITIKAWRAGSLAGEDCIDVRRMPAAAGSWQATSTDGAPAARDSHSAVWTGSQMIV
jgi:hypothetical protein